MTNHLSTENEKDSSEHLDGCNNAAESGAASTEYDMIVVDECGEEADRFLSEKVTGRKKDGEKQEVGHATPENLPGDGEEDVDLRAQTPKSEHVRNGEITATRKDEEGNGKTTDQEPIGGARERPAVSASERVLWQDPGGQCHYTPIQDIPLKPGVYSGTIDHPAMRPEFYEVRASRRRLVDTPLVEVKMREGMSIKTTHAHGLLTMGKNGKLRRIRPGEVVEGETLVPRARPNVPFGTGPGSVSMETPSGKGKQLEITLDRDAGFIYGVYVAEGSACNEGYKHVQIAATERDIWKPTIDILERWGLKTRRYERNISTTCAALGRTLAETCGTGAENKRIPDLLWTAPESFRDGFISGYLSGDGTVNGGEVCATTVSKELADGLVFLLAAMGVRASHRMYELEEHQDQYLIKLYQEGIENLPELALTRKQKRVVKIQDSKTKFSRDRVPIPENLKTAVVRALRENDVANSVYRTGYASRPCLSKVYGELPARMQAIIDAPLWWEVVESVEETSREPPVCSLVMGNGPSFMVGGGLLACSSLAQ